MTNNDNKGEIFSEKEISCCFTGHRVIPTGIQRCLEQILLLKIENAIKIGYKIFCVGGALGFDTMAALAVLKLKEKYPHIILHLYLPYPQQVDKWSSKDRAIYDNIKNQSRKILFAGLYPDKLMLQSRNRAMVDNCAMCIAYCTKATGGTAYTYGYAIDSGIQTINLADVLR